YWSAVITRGGPAMQRLRPQLWPHVYAEQQHPSLSSYVYDLVPQPLPQHQQRILALDDVAVSTSLLPPVPLVAEPVTSRPEHLDSTPASHVAHEARQAWTALDWLLAAYRVVLGLLACRAVFGPSRSSSIFLL
ncbi:hypothetical protein GGI08_005141, partial [Coemansia sp. S2]